MDYIKRIRLSKDEFIIENDTASLKLPYRKDSKKFIIDISTLNLISATKVAILCSTYCFINGFKKKLSWLVKDEETKRAIGILRLKNMESNLLNQNSEEERIAIVS